MKVAFVTFMLNVSLIFMANVYEALASHVLMTNHEVIYIVSLVIQFFISDQL